MVGTVKVATPKPKAKGRPPAPTHTNSRHSAARVNRPGPNAKAKRMLAFRVITDRIKQKNPANTVWTKRATAVRDEFVRNNPRRHRTIHNKQLAGTTKHVRHRGRWLFAAVRVGTGAAGRSPGNLCTVANKLKRFSFTWLPDSLLTATGTARGTPEMAAALRCCVRQGSLVVHDCWWPTAAALNKLNYEQAPAVNHSNGFREHVEGQRSGWHSNDAESEFARLKGFVRSASEGL